MNSKATLLEVKKLNSVFPSGDRLVRAVNDVSFTLEDGEILGIVGESGCGKSTMLLSLLRLIRYPGKVESGAIRFRGEDLVQMSSSQMREMRGRQIAMIFQDPLSTLNPAFTVGEQIRESLRLHNMVGNSNAMWPFDRIQREQEKQRVLQLMSEVGIPSPMDRYASYPHQFSGGMQQRTLIAIALACNPKLLLADEPTTALDVTIQAQIMNLMKQINKDHGTAIILVTHDLGLASEFCDRIAVMYAGRIVEQGTVDEIVEMPQHPYTQGLLNCRPRIGEREKTIRPINGNVPSLADLPDGCAFASRCSVAGDICNDGPIPLFETNPGHLNRCLLTSDYKRLPDWEWDAIIEQEAVR